MQLISNYITDTKVCIWTLYRTNHYPLRFHPSLTTQKGFRCSHVANDLFNGWLNSKEIYKPTKEEWKEIIDSLT